ncbi:hypothetical protein ACFYPC_03480 [Streptomyces sp. NPDC005808]|uniref:hypothetical protein n=1 Tax=Streptomyces sp. NPDC005808 TaxID=3364734 RepID=UPI0036C9FF4C
MTLDDGDRGFVGNARRFFWFPREEPREAAPILPLAHAWLFFTAAGGGVVAVGWTEFVDLIGVWTVLAMLDDVTKGVRHRWPAFIAGLLVFWSIGKLVRRGLPAPADPDWADYPALVCGSLAALVVFAAITRVRPRPEVRPPD